MQAEGNVVSLRERDTEAPRDFSVFFSNESGKLFEALYFVTGNRADAAELMQDAFLKLWERWDSIDRINDCRASSVEIDRLRAVTSARDHPTNAWACAGDPAWGGRPGRNRGADGERWRSGWAYGRWPPDSPPMHSFLVSAASSFSTDGCEAIEPVIGARAFGFPRAEAWRDGRSNGGHALLPADILSSTVQLGAQCHVSGHRAEMSRDILPPHDRPWGW
jgi:hypothetical protein